MTKTQTSEGESVWLCDRCDHMIRRADARAKVVASFLTTAPDGCTTEGDVHEVDLCLNCGDDLADVIFGQQ